MSSYLIWLVVGYLLGSIPTGYVLCGLLFRKDIRSSGSGNIGATNVYRTFGLIPGLVVLVLDIGKGWLPVWLARQTGSFSSPVLISLGLATVIGHTFPIWLRGHGGKGVATSFGVMLGLFPWPAVSCFLLWLLVLLLTRYVSAASIAGAVVLAPLIYHFQHDWTLTGCGLLVTILILWRHRENIKRLLAGTENRFIFPWERR